MILKFQCAGVEHVLFMSGARGVSLRGSLCKVWDRPLPLSIG